MVPVRLFSTNQLQGAYSRPLAAQTMADSSLQDVVDRLHLFSWYNTLTALAGAGIAQMQGFAGQRQSQASNALAGWHGSGSPAAAPQATSQAAPQQQVLGHMSCALAPVPACSTASQQCPVTPHDVGQASDYIPSSLLMSYN